MKKSFKQLCILCALTICYAAPVMASWSKPETLTSYAHEASSPVVAVNATGYAIAVWSEFNGENVKIRSAVRHSEAGWSTATDLSVSGEDAYSPSVAMNASGNTIVAWEAYDGLSSKINVKLRTFGGSWSEVITISDPWVNSFNAKVTIDNIGNAVVIWESYDTENISIQAVRRTYFGVWGNPETISTRTDYAFQPDVVSSSNGNVVAIWTAYDGVHLYTESASLVNGFWTDPEYLSDSFFDAINPQITISASGDALAVWSGFDGSNFTIQASIKFADNDWSPSMVLSAPGQDAYYPQAAMDAAGNAVAVWSRNNGSNFVIQGSSLYINYSASSHSIFWTDPTDLSGLSEDAANPRVAVDPSGNAAAVWTRLNGANFVLQASELPFGCSWTSPVDISDTTLEAISPNLVIDAKGNTLVVWAEYYSNFVIQSSEGNALFCELY